MNIKEMRQAVEILGKEWNLGKKESGAEGNICAWIYLYETKIENIESNIVGNKKFETAYVYQKIL